MYPSPYRVELRSNSGLEDRSPFALRESAKWQQVRPSAAFPPQRELAGLRVVQSGAKRRKYHYYYCNNPRLRRSLSNCKVHREKLIRSPKLQTFELFDQLFCTQAAGFFACLLQQRRWEVSAPDKMPLLLTHTTYFSRPSPKTSCCNLAKT